MNADLLINMFYAAPELWYSLGIIFLSLIAFNIYFAISILRLKQKTYFINRDRNRYAETLYASKDGYFAFIYPDNKVNDPRKRIRERCSRRLALILNLGKGVESTFEDVLDCFYKNSATKISQYINLLITEGIAFEEDFITKNDNRHIKLNGCRISNNKDTFCDMIWFRDITLDKSKIFSLEEEKKGFFKKMIQFEDMINNIPYPVWLRDKNLNISLTNKKYQSLIESKNQNIKEDIEILDTNGESISKNIALIAVSSNKPKGKKSNVIIDGQIKTFDVLENPFYSELELDNICSVGTMIDSSELEQFKRNLKLDKDSQLELFGSLGNTAFAVFDKQYNLSFCNNFFKSLWKLDKDWSDKNLGYVNFLDIIREKRLLPEVPNFIQYKKDEEKAFGEIFEPKEDMLHIPDGRTIRRVRANYPAGGLIFAYEDVSDKLATRRAYNELISIQNEILNNISDAILIFSTNGKISSYNKKYIDMWKVDENIMSNEPNMFEIVNHMAIFFNSLDWITIKSQISDIIDSPNNSPIVLERNDNQKVEIRVKTLPDSSAIFLCKNL